MHAIMCLCVLLFLQGLCYSADNNAQTDSWGLYVTLRLSTEAVCPVEPSTEKRCSTVPHEMCPHRLQYTVCHELKRALADGMFRGSDRQWVCQLIDQYCDKVCVA